WITPPTVIATPHCCAEGLQCGPCNKRNQPVDKFKGALMVGALRLFAKLPWGAVQRVGAGIGWLMWKIPNSSRNVVRINLAKCFPEMDPAEREKLVGRALMDIGKSFTESACAWIWPAQRSLALVREVQGLE